MVDDANIVIALIVDKDWYAFREFIEGIWALSKIRGSDYKVLLLNKSPYRIPCWRLVHSLRIKHVCDP